MRIYLDLEATEYGEVLAIGAVDEDGNRFQEVVRPTYTPLTERITALTGIDERTIANAHNFIEVANNFQFWAWSHACDNQCDILTFGKNDSGFLRKTYDLFYTHGASPDDVEPMIWLINHTHNGANPIYQAFRRSMISLRSAYLTYTENEATEALNGAHLPIEDAAMFKILYEAVRNGWVLPEGANLVTVKKPTLPPKQPKEDFNTPPELHRTVVVYWTRGNQDKCAAFRDLITAAKATCTKALNAGISPEQAAYRVLDAAINGESYCDRKFFLVD